jgi:hypothetical protein
MEKRPWISDAVTLLEFLTVTFTLYNGCFVSESTNIAVTGVCEWAPIATAAKNGSKKPILVNVELI